MNIAAFVHSHGGTSAQFAAMTTDDLLKHKGDVMQVMKADFETVETLNNEGVLEDATFAASALFAKGDLLAAAEYQAEAYAMAIITHMGEKLLKEAAEYAAELESREREDLAQEEYDLRRLGTAA